LKKIEVGRGKVRRRHEHPAVKILGPKGEDLRGVFGVEKKKFCNTLKARKSQGAIGTPPRA